VPVKQPVERENSMKKETKSKFDDELRGEYDFSRLKGGVRGKYAQRYREGTNLVLLAPDVAAVFPDDRSVNQALRLLIKAAKTGKIRSR
jgi:hypothetical protein